MRVVVGLLGDVEVSWLEGEVVDPGEGRESLLPVVDVRGRGFIPEPVGPRTSRGEAGYLCA